MENYKKVLTSKSPFPKFNFISKECIHMNVKNGSKIKNLIQFGIKKIEDTNINQIAWWGDDKAITKTIACAEHVKKNYKSVLYQTTKIFYNEIMEKYESLLGDSETIEVKRNIPTILILLSKCQFNEIGLQYQSSEMNISDIVFNSSCGKALKILKKIKRKPNFNSRLTNSVLNKENQ